MRLPTGHAPLFALACLIAAPALAQTPPAAPVPAPPTAAPAADATRGPTPAPAPAAAKPAPRQFPAIAIAPPAAVTQDPANLWVLDLSTGGRVTILLRPDVAPQHVERIRTLTRQRFYDGLTFHRVIDGFMAQGGDPQGTGQGGSPLPDLKAEFNRLPHMRGAVAMARAQGEDSANSQFYIVLQPVLRIDRNYTVLGRVTSGMGFVDALEKGEPPANPSRIVRAYLAADNPPPFTAQPAGLPPAPATLPSGPMTPPPTPRN